MEKMISKNIIEYCKVSEGDNILLGISGGPDSVFLFHILVKLKEKLGFNLYCAHINHMYRGVDADNDEKFVVDLCEKFNVKCYTARKNASIYAQERNITEEEAGRVIRYGFFNDILDKIENGLICTAHNYNDQVETVLQRIIRGTGIDGLSGMEFRKDNIIRPILNVKRIKIEKYLEVNNYEYCTDYTNLLPIYGRNKLRLELIPFIEKNYNPKFSDSLFKLSQTAKLDRDIINDVTEKIYHKIANDDKKDIKLNLCKFNRLNKGLKNRVIRYSIEKLKGNTVNIEFAHIENIIGICSKELTGKTTNIPGNIVVEVSYNDIIIKNKVEIKDYEYNVNIGESFVIKENGVKFQSFLTDKKILTESPYQTCIDYDKIVGNLKIRNRRNGDKFTPLGMRGQKKLKNFFIDERVPRDIRDVTPIITDDSEIIWIAGYRISDKYKIDKNTIKFMIMEIKEV